jgi:hypothetical protein
MFVHNCTSNNGCVDINILPILKKLDIKTVILANYWTQYYVQSARQNLEHRTDYTIDYPYMCSSKTERTATTYLADYQNTIHYLLSNGLNVLLIYPIPEPGYNIPLHARTMKQSGVTDEYTFSLASHLSRTKYIRESFNKMQHENLVRICPEEILCDVETCRTQSDDLLYYYDDNHLSIAGVYLFEKLFRRAFETLAM